MSLLRRSEETTASICDFLDIDRFDRPPAVLEQSTARAGIDAPDEADIVFLRALFAGDLEQTELLLGREVEPEYAMPGRAAAA